MGKRNFPWLGVGNGTGGTGVKVCVSGPDLSHACGQGGADLSMKWIKRMCGKKMEKGGEL